MLKAQIGLLNPIEGHPAVLPHDNWPGTHVCSGQAANLLCLGYAKKSHDRKAYLHLRLDVDELLPNGPDETGNRDCQRKTAD
jgi:hypothetical protein